jgi:hypothetical protein
VILDLSGEGGEGNKKQAGVLSGQGRSRCTQVPAAAVVEFVIIFLCWGNAMHIQQPECCMQQCCIRRA